MGRGRQNGASSATGLLAALLAGAFFAVVFLAAVFFVAFFFATFFVAFLAAFFAGVFFVAVFLVAAFLAGAFLAAFLPKRPRIGLPVSSISCCTSASVSEAGSRSLGMRPLRRPSLM